MRPEAHSDMRPTWRCKGKQRRHAAGLKYQVISNDIKWSKLSGMEFHVVRAMSRSSHFVVCNIPKYSKCFKSSAEASMHMLRLGGLRRCVSKTQHSAKDCGCALLGCVTRSRTVCVYGARRLQVAQRLARAMLW